MNRYVALALAIVATPFVIAAPLALYTLAGYIFIGMSGNTFGLLASFIAGVVTLSAFIVAILQHEKRKEELEARANVSSEA